MAKAKEAYKDHRPGSRKGAVHKAFDEGGAKKALKVGEKLELSPRSVGNWISAWSGTGTKAAAKKVVKKTAKVAKAKKAVKKVAKKAVAKKVVKKAPAKKVAAKRAPKVAPAAAAEAAE